MVGILVEKGRAREKKGDETERVGSERKGQSGLHCRRMHLVKLPLEAHCLQIKPSQEEQENKPVLCIMFPDNVMQNTQSVLVKGYHPYGDV